MPSRYSTDYRNLRPYVLEDARAVVKAAISAGWSGGNAAALTAHRLDDTTVHVGTLADSQAPQFLMRNGSRSLAGNLPVDTGVTIDGVDLDVHASNPDAHHARAHVLATAAGLGADHSMSGAAAGQVLRANSATNALWAYLSHNDLTGVTADQHHAKQHDIIDAANHTVAGAAWSVVGATAANTLGLMLARNDATGTPKETLLKTDASGYLTLVRLIASDRLRTSLLDTPAGQHLTVQPAVDLLLDPVSKLVKAQTDVALQASNYASQVTGWRITHNGQIDARFLFVDEMHAKSFIADLEQALAGGQIISKSVALLATAFTAPAANTTVTNGLRVRDLPSAPGMAVFQSGDIVALRAFSRSAGSLSIGYCWGVVTSYTNMGDGTQTWTFSRSAAPNAGAMAAGTVIQPDAIVLDFGTDGNGYYEVNAIDGANAINSVYLQFVRWTGHPATGQAVRTRLGNLRGIFGQDEYGLFAGTGTANTDRYVRVSDYAAGNGINNLPFSLRNAGVEVVRLGGWNDVWFSPDGGTTKKLAWDGSNLTIIGSVTITGGSGYGNLSDKPTSLSAINGTESAKLAGIAAGATVGATWGTNLGSIPIRFADAPSGNGLYLTASYMGYYVGGAWKTYIDNGGNFRFSYDASNYLEFNASTNRLRGVGGGTDQWYASAVDGKLYFGGGAGALHASGMTLYRQLETDTPGLSWMVGTTNYGGLSYYQSGGGGTFETVGLRVRADPSRIVLAVYNPGDANNPPASITIQQNAYVPLVTIKGVIAVPVGKLTSDNVFALRNAADSAYQSLNLQTVGVIGGKILSDNIIQARNAADSAYQEMRAIYFYSVNSIWYSGGMHQFRDANSGNYNTMRSKAHYIESSADPGAGSGAIAIWFDGTNLRATLPGGTTKTFTWT